ncbi:MAG: hypothetical protein AABY11_00230 [archaeon]
MAVKQKKKTAAQRSTKAIRKQVKGVSTQVKRATKRQDKQNLAVKAELSKLTKEMKNLKQTKASPKRELSLYNLYVRKRIQQGRTFDEAVQDWKQSSKVIENPSLAKPKTRTITKTRIVTRTLRAKRPKKTLENDSLSAIVRDLSALKTDLSGMSQERPSMNSKKSVNAMDVDLSNEEVAVRLTRLYFEEIARLGFKRRLDFDSIINAYYYCLQRLNNREKELDVMRKVVEREENKLQGETKANLFPIPEQ